MDDKFEFDLSSARKDEEAVQTGLEAVDSQRAGFQQDNSDILKSAGFNERFIAYVIDALPFVAACYWTLVKLVSVKLIVFNTGNEFKWKIIWILLYLAYETIFSSGGRATLGKYIMGIRVRNADGSYLSAGKAFLRSVSYFLSSIPLNAGFLMALFTAKKRALHDYIGSSRVVRVKEKGPLAEGFIIVVSWGLLAFFIGSWLNQSFFTFAPSEKKQIILAKRSLSRIAYLEEIHKQRYGGYTSDMKRLIVLSRNARFIKEDLIKNIEIDSLMISSNGEEYVISAKAKNWRKSKVKIGSVHR